MKGYYTQAITYDREGDTVYPVRIKREWADDGNGKRMFGITECETLAWQNLPNTRAMLERAGQRDWSSNRIKPETRAQLIASGVIRLPGDGWPNGCLMINP